MKVKREYAETDIFCWHWEHKGICPDGTKVKFKGTIQAPNERMGNTASDTVNRELRAKHPEITWMQGHRIEGDGLTYGPTVWRGKFIKEGPTQ